MKKILLPLFAWGAGTMSLLAQPVITIQPTNQIVLNGSNATFSVAASGLGLLSYQWRFNGTNLPKNFVVTVAGGGNGDDGGSATSAGLNYPYGVTVDANSNFFIVEGGGNRIRKIDTNGIITTVAGNGSTGYAGDNGLATNASLNFPLQVVVDSIGNLYIADHDNNRIRKVDSAGIITTVAGNGVADYSGDGGQATNASLHFPSALTLDNAGNLYIADYWNNRIRRVDVNGIITTMAGNGSTAYSGDGGQATNASLNVPNGIVFDSAGNLFIADYGNSRIRKVDSNGIITTVAGNGQPFAGGDGGAATNASLQDAVYVVADIFGRLFITDVYDGLIRQVDTNGIITTAITGLNNPAGLSVDQFDNLYIAESQADRVDKVALLGLPALNLNQVTTNNAGNYDVIISDAHGSVTSSIVSLTVNVPAFIATQPQSQSVSVASNVTFNVSAGGTLPLTYQWLSNGATIAGATNASYPFNVTATNLAGGYSVIITNNFGSVTSSVATLMVLVLPPSIASQPGSKTVPAGSNALFTVVSSGSPPFNYQWFFNSTSLDGQTNASLSLLNATTNQAGAYYVLVNSPYGSITSHVATLTVGWFPTITSQPTNQSVLASSRALMTAAVSGVGPLTFQWQLNGTNLPNNLITTIAGNGTAGFGGDGGIATTGKINFPYGIVADSAGNLFFADSANYRIRKVDASGMLTTVAGTGGASFSGDGGAATNARLNTSYAVAVDGMGNLFIADTLNSRIRKVDTNGIITTVVGKSSAGFSGDGGAATNATLNSPSGIALDNLGNLFIADTSNNRVRKVDTNGIIATVAGKSSAGFSGDGGAATNASLNAPRSVALDGAGNLLIADAGNNRIRKMDGYGFISTSAGNGSATFSGDNGASTNAGINPYAVSVDGYGDVLIADRSNNRIRRVDPYGIITTVAGTNTFGYNGDGLVATNTRLFNPSGVKLDNYGRVLIADTGNNRIRRFGQGPTLVLDSVNATNAGNYTLVVNSSFGSVTSVVAKLTVFLPPQQFIGQFASGGLQVHFSGTPNYPYILQSATNLTPPINWQPILTNPADGYGNWQFTDTNLNGSQKFYRAVGQ